MQKYKILQPYLGFMLGGSQFVGTACWEITLAWKLLAYVEELKKPHTITLLANIKGGEHSCVPALSHCAMPRFANWLKIPPVKQTMHAYIHTYLWHAHMKLLHLCIYYSTCQWLIAHNYITLMHVYDIAKQLPLGWHIIMTHFQCHATLLFEQHATVLAMPHILIIYK